MTAEQAERFWSKVDIREMDECWEWTAATYASGHGMIRIDHELRRAHRVAFEFEHGPLESSEVKVRHTCDNPPCCNPGHLIKGSQAENMADMRDRRRGTLGERNRHAKLTWPLVLTIRNAPETTEELAVRLGVNKSTISRVRSGATWREG